MAYEIRYTRLANSTKISDRYITVQVKNSTDPEKLKMGTIFALIEITNPWYPNSQIGQSIINVLTQEYYKQDNEDLLTNFENALKKVNQNLARITQEGESDWIGNINAILALVCDNEIHLTRTGKAEAFLFRDNKVNKITDGSVQITENPLKTFFDIVSGEINKKDKILITSPALLDYLSQKEIQDIISNNSPYESMITISQFLRQEKARHINSVLFEINSKSDSENHVLDNKEVVYLDQVSNINLISTSAKKYMSQVGPTAENFSKNVAEFYEKVKHFFIKEVNPRTKSAWEKTKKISSDGYTHLKTKTAPQVKSMIQPISDKVKANIKNYVFKPKIEEVPSNGTPDENAEPYSVNYYESNKNKSKIIGALNQVFGNVKLFFGKVSRTINDYLSHFNLKKSLPIVYILIVVILIIILALSVTDLRKKQNNKNQEATQMQTLNDAKNDLSDAKTKILYNDLNSAKTLLNEAINKATSIMNSDSKYASDAKDVIVKVNDEFDKLTSTTRFNSPTLVAEAENITNIFIINDKLMAINKKNTELFQTSKDKQGEISTLNPISNGNSLQAVGFDSTDNNILALDSKSELYKIKESGTSEKIGLSKGTWENAVDLSIFGSNIYLLNAEGGQIYKHNSSPSGYSSGTNYIDSSKIDIKNAVSFSIDGSVYVLKSDGALMKLSRGAEQDFALHNIPVPNDKLTKPKKVWTTSEINFLYVLDDNRIIEFDKEGKFTRQFAFSPDIKNITDFSINPTDKKIWILDNNKVYMVGL